MKKWLDILLFPRSLYKKISDKKLTLYIGIIFIGLVDLGFPLADNFKSFYTGDGYSRIVYNIALTIIFTILLGAIDILFFSIPISDLFKRFKKGNKPADGNQVYEKGLFIKLIKVYMIAHFLILLPEIISFIIYRNIANTLVSGVTTNNLNSVLLYIAFFIDVLIPFWFSGAITRGVDVVYEFKPLYKRLVFLVIFVWNYLLGYALSYMISNWILKLFRV
ncbi:MAG TPA: hypothetical protein PK733_08180 [Clostridiales bacterium]|nr:hypothetical protein [Clostridiales bacterium]